jgi:hypothetical protein
MRVDSYAEPCLTTAGPTNRTAFRSIVPGLLRNQHAAGDPHGLRRVFPLPVVRADRQRAEATTHPRRVTAESAFQASAARQQRPGLRHSHFVNAQISTRFQRRSRNHAPKSCGLEFVTLPRCRLTRVGSPNTISRFTRPLQRRNASGFTAGVRPMRPTVRV